MNTNLNILNKTENGYIAAVLTEESADLLKELAIHPEIYCHHLTIVYKPTEEHWQKYGHLIGQNIKLEIVGVGFSDKAQAALVKGCPTENEFPHITISCARNTPPKDSMEIFKKNKIIDLNFQLDAEIKFIPFESNLNNI
jgi:hypothetical protein